ncbi:UbiH/UbiF family hydroxylase [Chitinibacter tainanensis]|uniref:UbiH/UbiF family hydroxylase n=1 Tax=Chitinibacter tainanensis TaxID=230667 RepID=UPI002355BFFA|nr:UbiH/UbiF family hydroxylase [Chitinibacter tainanensis]
MKAYDADVIVLGGGLVGSALALALRHSAHEVILIEGREPQLDWPVESWDQRVYAISRASQQLLAEIGAWEQLRPARLCPVSAMKIRGDGQSQLDFSALDSGVDALATILENRELQRALWLALGEAPNVRIISGVQAQQLEISPSAATLTLSDGQQLSARLIVGADGANSWLRQQAGIEVKTRPYGQAGVVANFACEKPHYGVAQQWFRPDGILAFLPLPDQQMSMVWSCADALRDELLQLDPAALAARVAQAGNMSLGALQLITPAAAFPLRLNQPDSIVRARVALIGDAAHTVHPLAGQGVNLGFGDVQELAQLLQQTPAERLGDVLVLRRYERARREPVLLMQTVCDGLQRLFDTPHPLVKAMRNFGLAATDQLPWLKRQLIRHAMDS